jgi:hypothetical protein
MHTYDCGVITVATAGMANTNVVGRLYLSYEVELYKPQSSPINQAQYSRITSWYYPLSSQTLATGTTTQWDIGNSALSTNDPLGVGNPVAGVWTPFAGNYRVEAQVNFETTSAANALFYCQWAKNGAALGPQAAVTPYATAGSLYANLTCSIIASCNGTDTLQLNVTAIAGGTITIPAQSSIVYFTLA